MFEYQYAILHYQKHEPQETNEKAEYVSETACLNIAIENPQVPSLEFFDHEILKIRYWWESLVLVSISQPKQEANWKCGENKNSRGEKSC